MRARLPARVGINLRPITACSAPLLLSTGAALNNTGAALNNTGAALNNTGALLYSTEAVLANTAAVFNSTRALLKSTGAALKRTGALLPSTSFLLASPNAALAAAIITLGHTIDQTSARNPTPRPHGPANPLPPRRLGHLPRKNGGGTDGELLCDRRLGQGGWKPPPLAGWTGGGEDRWLLRPPYDRSAPRPS
jgi:hypothetical protein